MKLTGPAHGFSRDERRCSRPGNVSFSLGHYGTAVDLAFLLPVFQDAMLCAKLRSYLPEDLFANKWEVLMREPA